MSEQQWEPQYYPPPQDEAGRFYQDRPAQTPPAVTAYSAPGPAFEQGAWPQPYDDAQPQPPRDAVAGGAPQQPKKRRKIPTPVLAGCVLALVLAGGAYALTGQGNPSPTAGSGSGMTANGQLKTIWAAGGTAGNKIVDFSASWVSSDTVVDARVDGAIAYQMSNGAQAWGWQVPNGDQVCYMSTNTSEGIGVIAYGALSAGDVQYCDHLVALKVDSGRALYTINLDPEPETSADSYIEVQTPYVSISGDTLAAQGEDQRLTVFDLKTGKTEWQSPDLTQDTIVSAMCNPEGIAIVQQTVYELNSCISTAQNGGQLNRLYAYTLSGSNASNPKQMSGIGVVPANVPPELWQAGDYLLVVGSGLTSTSDVLAYNAAAGSSVPVNIAMADYGQSIFQSSSDGQLNPRGWAVFGDTMYLEDKGNSNQSVVGVAAVSLKTGRRLWDETPGGNTDSAIVDASAGGVEVVMSVPQQSGYRLANLAASSGTPSYGPGTYDDRFYIDSSNSTLYIENTYLVNIEDMTIADTPGIVVLSGVTR